MSPPKGWRNRTESAPQAPDYGGETGVVTVLVVATFVASIALLGLTILARHCKRSAMVHQEVQETDRVPLPFYPDVAVLPPAYAFKATL